MKKTTLIRLFKIILWGGLLSILLTLVTGLTLRALVKQKDLEQFVTNVIKKQTGGQLVFRVEAFDILREIRITEIQFKGPKTEIGFGEGGELADEPLMIIDEIKFNPSVQGLWRGTMKLSGSILKPSFTLDLRKAQNNLSGLLGYRAKNFPKVESLTPWYQLPTLPISLDKIFVPGSFDLTEFLISDLSLRFINDSMEIRLGPLDMKSFLKIYRKTIQSSFKLESDRGLLLFKSKDQEARWRLNLNNEFQILSWTEFSFACTNKVAGTYLVEPLIASSSLKINVAPDLSSFSLDDLKFDLGNDIKMGGSFFGQFPDHTLLAGLLRSSFQTNINLENPITRIVHKMFNLKISGRFKNKLSLEGPFEISKEKRPIQLPPSLLTFQGDSINAFLGDPLSLKNFNLKGDIQIKSLDNDVAVIPNVSVSFAEASFEKDKLKVSLKDLKSSLSAQAQLFLRQLDQLSLNLSLASLAGKMEKKEIFNENVAVEVKGSSLEKLSNLDINGKGSMGKLVQTQFGLTCDSPCKTVSMVGGFVVQKIMPILEVLKDKIPKESMKFVPTFIEGSVEGRAEVSLLLPPLDKKNIQPEDFAPVWKLSGDLKNLSLKVPFQAADLAGVNGTIRASGDLLTGEVTTGLKIDKLGISPSPTQNVQVLKSEFSAKTQINLTHLKHIKEKAVTSTSWSLNVKTLQLTLPQEFLLSNHSMEGSLSTLGLKSLKFDVHKGSFVDGGIQTRLGFTADLKNEELNSKFSTKIFPEKFETYVPGLKATGVVTYEGTFNVKDLEQLSLTSSSSIEKLSLSYAQPGSAMKMAVELIQGRVPVSFYEKISEIKKWFQKNESQNLSETIETYLKNESQVNEISTPEANLLSWRDSKPTREKNLKIYKAYLNGVGVDEFEGGVEISSKAILVKNFQGSVLGGKVQGSAFLPISPMPERVLLTAHVKGIDSSQIPRLIGKTSSGKDFLPISGNFHMDFLVRNSQMDGVFDVTSIGAEQMNYMLEMVDPDHADSSINNIRRALKIGSLKKALVIIKRGEMSLDLDVRLAGAPIPLPNLNGIKVSNMIENIKADILSKKESL